MPLFGNQAGLYSLLRRVGETLSGPKFTVENIERHTGSYTVKRDSEPKRVGPVIKVEISYNDTLSLPYYELFVGRITDCVSFVRQLQSIKRIIL